MPAKLIQAPSMGINATLPDTLITQEEAGRRTQNLLYENGMMTTPEGFIAVDVTTGLDVEYGSKASNTNILGLAPFRELDGYNHLLAVTGRKIFEHDRVNNNWNGLTQSGLTMSSQYPNPVSFTESANGYGSVDPDAIFLNDDSNQAQSFFHSIISNGGLDNIQRWAGRFETDYADLLGGDGYHDGTTHRAIHVSDFRSRLILLNPQTFVTSSNSWLPNNQTVRWPRPNRPQTWSGGGSGAVTLIDTGGSNLWAAPLGGTHIIYQTTGIWDMNYVGGTTVFDPRPMIPDLGLLAPHLLYAKNNVHYFIGTDFNVYAYFGGTVKERLGDKIHPLLQQQLSSEFAVRSWMSFDENNKRLWIYIVLEGESFSTMAYGLDIRTGAWQVRDFKDKYNGTTGISALAIVGSQTFVTGDSYNKELDTLSLYQSDISQQTISDTTIRYGDVLEGDLTTNTIDQTFDYSTIFATAGGLTFDITPTGAGTDITTDFANRPILKIADGSDGVNMPFGTHFYTVSGVSQGPGVADFRFTIAPRDTTGNAFADNSNNIPDSSTLTVFTFFDASGATYREEIEEVLKQARLMIGDNSGFVYEFDATNTDYGGSDIISRHPTSVDDFDQPDLFKRWVGLSITARACPNDPTNGSVKLRYRINNFDTSDTGWLGDFTIDVTSQWKEYKKYHNVSSKRIQYEFDNISGSNFQISEYKILEPQLQDDR
jgi:hypothetical protein